MRNDTETRTGGVEGAASPQSHAPARRRLVMKSRPWPVRVLLAVACVATLVPFYRLNLQQSQLWLLLCWLAGMALYLFQWPLPGRRGLARPSPWLVAGLAAFALTLFGAFCLVYDNWRWAVVSDSLDFYSMGSGLVHRRVNPFQIGGVFQQCTVTQAALQNMFMFVSESMFTHRLGNLLTSTLLVLAAARFAAQTTSSTTGVLVGLFLPLNSVFAFLTLISYPNLSGVLPYYAACTLFVSAWQRRTSGFLWAALGLVCGLAFYFLPLWAQGVGWAGLGMGILTIRWRAPRVMLIWAGGFLIALLPTLMQIPTLIGLWTIFRSTQGQSLSYFSRMFTQTLLLPVGSETHAYGAHGAWLPLPFGYLFPAGVLLALAGALLGLLGRPRAHCLRHAWVWLVMYVLDAAALALNNSGYGAISTKRAILLLPGMTFLMVLPLAWVIERVRRPWFAVPLTILSVAGYAYLNVNLLRRTDFGYTAADGMLRMIQTAPLPVHLFTPSAGLEARFGRKRVEFDALDDMYGVRKHTVVVGTVPAQRSDFNRTVCFSKHTDGPEWGGQMRAALSALCPGKQIEPINLQIECVICDPP